MERCLARIHAEKILHHRYSGRQLYRPFKRQQLAEIKADLYPCFVTNYAFLRQAGLLDETEQIAFIVAILTREMEII